MKLQRQTNPSTPASRVKKSAAAKPWQAACNPPPRPKGFLSLDETGNLDAVIENDWRRWICTIPANSLSAELTRSAHESGTLASVGRFEPGGFRERLEVETDSGARVTFLERLGNGLWTVKGGPVAARLAANALIHAVLKEEFAYGNVRFESMTAPAVTIPPQIT
jgi:hypothetical protein